MSAGATVGTRRVQASTGIAAEADRGQEIGAAFVADLPKRCGRPESVGLITPSHRGDLERCAMLFESIDRHIPARGNHYVVVHDEDVPLFERFRRSDRLILPVSDILPRWLVPVPFLRWRGRRYWCSRHGKPISGWHTQQLVKIEAARSLPETRYCLIDSDNVFFRDFDLAPLAAPNPVPLRVDAQGIHAERPRHTRWIATASRLLGVPQPPLPADDYIDQIIVWDQDTVRAMVARIEVVTGRDWMAAMCRDRDFSEYLIYGHFVANTPFVRALHESRTESLCSAYWDEDALSPAEIMAMLNAASERQVAICIQSFGRTSPETIRASLRDFHATTEMKSPIVGSRAA